MKTTAKVTCRCKGGSAADFQDKQYGPGVRIANLTEKGDTKQSVRTYRCTVCGAEHQARSE